MNNTKYTDYNSAKLVAFVIIVTLYAASVNVYGYHILSDDSVKPDLSGIRVAVYNGRGTENLPSSWIALNAMFTWMNATTEYINATQIRNNNISHFDIIAYPGGDETSYRLSLHEDGLENLRQFVANGGSYFGICGGSTFATKGRLDLFDGYPNFDPPGYMDGIYLTDLSVNRESTGPDLSQFPATLSVFYWSSSYFESDTVPYIPIMNYPNTNLSCMIAFEYGNGTAFLSSPHPEYEEGSMRDGTSSYDYLDDEDSEWDLLLEVSLWLIEASYTEEQATSTTSITTEPTTPYPTESISTTTSSTISTTAIQNQPFLVLVVGVSVIGMLGVILLIKKYR